MALVLVKAGDFEGPGFAMGSWPAPSPASYEIIFHKLKITRYDDPYLKPTIENLAESGVYSQISISTFISNVQAQNFPSTGKGPLYYEPGDTPPDIVAKHPCYVVIQIVGNNDDTLSFQDDIPALRTEYDRHTKYRGLAPAYYDVDGHCRVIKFQNFDASERDPDLFNMYLQYISPEQPAGPPIPWLIDPKIKNRGDQVLVADSLKE